MSAIIHPRGFGFVRFLEDGHDVIIVDDLSTGKKENINPKTKFSHVDISSKTSGELSYLSMLMEGVDVVFHTAAKARVQPSIGLFAKTSRHISNPEKISELKNKKPIRQRALNCLSNPGRHDSPFIQNTTIYQLNLHHRHKLQKNKKKLGLYQ